METAQDAPQPPLPFGLHHLTAAMNALGTLWIVALMLLIVADVLGRNFLSAPVPGVPETVALSIVGIVFLQLADTLRCGRFIRAEVLLVRLARTRPAWHAGLSALWHAVGGALLLVVLWASWRPLVEAVQIREYVGAVGSFQAPVWPVRLITLIGLSVTALTYGLLVLGDLQRLSRLRREAPR
jgi:TRAP-type mannitol/chloroaromatic compound transport system permease small subunit